MAKRNSFAKKLVTYGLSVAAAISGGYLIYPWEGSVKNSDGLHTSYRDPIGIVTVCYGQTGTDLYGRRIQMGMTYTEEECTKMLSETIDRFEREVDARVTVGYASLWQKAAIISFVYNVGQGNFQSSTLLRKLNSGDHAGACDQLTRWVYANRQKLPGLVSRRGEEREWCMGNVPESATLAYEDIIFGYVKTFTEEAQ